MGHRTWWADEPQGAEASWSEAEWDWFAMGPHDGGIPGVVRRVRRVLDVSQRGLAALIGVSQSVVARWETGRTSPRASALHALLEMAGLRVSLHDEATGEEVEPMRDDGARQHGGSRFPAHTDLRATGWWVPAHLETTMVEYYQWRDRSRARRDPMIRAATNPFRKRLERLMYGTPDDHPSRLQLVAEVIHLDEVREERRLRARASRNTTAPAPR